MLTKLQLQVSSAQRLPTFPSHLHRLVHCRHNRVQSRAITKETHIQILGTVVLKGRRETMYAL